MLQRKTKSSSGPTLGWVRDALRARGYTQKDLARAWGVPEPSVSRFISGEELTDPPLSRSMALARMLGISVDDLAKGIGVAGKIIEPTVIASDAGLPPVGTFTMNMLEPGRVRVVMVQDMAPSVAGQLVAVLGTGGAANAN